MTPLLPSLIAVGDDLGGQEIYGPPLLFPPHWSCYGLSAQGRVFCVLDGGPFIGLWSVGSLAETHHKSVIRPGEPSLTRVSRMSTGLSSVLESLIKLGRNPPGNGLGHKAGPALLEDWQTSLVLPLLQFMLISPIAISDNFLYLVEVPFLQRYFIRIFVIYLKPLLY